MTRPKLARWLSVFADVKAEEVSLVLLLAARIFIILFGYYLLKPVREALILEHGSAELRAYAYGTQAAVLIFAVPLYSYFFHNRVGEMLYRSITTFFAINLLIFYLLGISGVPIGFIFFVWLGIFSIGQVAQFWALAADVHSVSAGQRVFGIIALGGALGAVAGSQTAHHLFPIFGTYGLLLLAAILLMGTTLIYKRTGIEEAMPHAPSHARQPLKLEGAFGVVMRSPYLRLVAIFVILLNFINSTGEYIFAKLVVHQVELLGLTGDAKGIAIGEIYSNFFMWVNITGMLFQAFLVSRLFRYIGVHFTVIILPTIAAIGYATITFFPVFTIVRLIKIMENSTDYSIQQTTRHALFLPVPQNEKYEGKTAIETFFWRFGDLLQAGSIYAGTHWFNLSLYQFAALNMTIAIFWIGLAWRIGQEYRTLAKPHLAASETNPA